MSALECASARIDITPRMPVPLAGYLGRVGPSTGVASPLEANAVLLSDGGAVVLFVSADLLYFGKDLTEALRRRAAHYGVPSTGVILAASHTHFAPATDADKPSLGGPDVDYLAFLQAQLSKLVDEVLSAPRVAVVLRLCQSRNDLAVNRRYLRKSPTVSRRGLDFSPRIFMAPNLPGERDDVMDVLRIECAGTGELVSLIWKFACHPVCFPRRTEVSAEFPGVAREVLREQWGRALPVVFWQGFTGDVRPRLVGATSWKDCLRFALQGPGFKPANFSEWQAWATRVARRLADTVASDTATPLDGALALATVELPLADVLEGVFPAERTLSFNRVGLGDHLEVIFVGAEVCTPYLSLMGGASSSLYSIYVGYVGDVFGYLPSASQVEAGGYEGGGFLPAFGYSAKFRDGFETRVAQAVARLRV